MKALILAAGLGKRMQPLTLETPKPLLKVGDITLIDHALQSIQKAKIKEVVINVHHLKEKIMHHCGDGSKYNVTIHYSIENELLETGGGILKALPLLGQSPFLVLSADVWTSYPLLQLTQKKTDGAHLVFVDNPSYHLQGDYGLDVHHIVRADIEKKLTYANIGVLNPKLFSSEIPGVFRLTQVLNPAIQKGLVTGEHYFGEWHNVGTEKELAALAATHTSLKN